MLYPIQYSAPGKNQKIDERIKSSVLYTELLRITGTKGRLLPSGCPQNDAPERISERRRYKAPSGLKIFWTFIPATLLEV